MYMFKKIKIIKLTILIFITIIIIPIEIYRAATIPSSKV